MVYFFESFLKNLSTDEITNTFFYLLVITALLGLTSFLTSRFKKSKRFANFAEYTPILLTSLGILGTFTGIVSGLLNFDIEHIDTSISSLLGGMKTAFLSSVFGVLLSILLKVFYTVFSKTDSKNQENNGLDAQAIVDNFYEQTDQLKRQNQHSESLISHIENLVKSLGSDSDSSVLGQLKLLRGDLSDRQTQFRHLIEPMAANLLSLQSLVQDNQQTFENFENKLWIKLQDFADMMSKSATEAVIDALKQVIQDFNNNLTEQFGENFKELNKAVTLLVDWQENYKKQLNEMISLYHAGVQSLSTTETSISNIENSTKSIPTTMENLSKVILTNQNQIDNLESHLATFAQLRDKAVEALPEIQKQISSMLENTEKANVELVGGLKQSGEKLASDIASISNDFKEKTSEATNELAKSLIDSGEKLNNNIVTVSNDFKEKTLEATTTLTKSFIDNGEVFTSKLTQATEPLVASITQNHNALVESATTLEKTAISMNDGQKTFLAQQSQLSTQITDFIMRWQQQFEQNTQQVQQQFTRTLEAFIQEHMQESRKLMIKLEKESETALSRTGESIDKQIKALDSALETELSRVIGNMGQALTSISHRFAEDYSELVEAMRRVTTKGRNF